MLLQRAAEKQPNKHRHCFLQDRMQEVFLYLPPELTLPPASVLASSADDTDPVVLTQGQLVRLVRRVIVVCSTVAQDLGTWRPGEHWLTNTAVNCRDCANSLAHILKDKSDFQRASNPIWRCNTFARPHLLDSIFVRCLQGWPQLGKTVLQRCFLVIFYQFLEAQIFPLKSSSTVSNGMSEENSHQSD